MLPLTDFHDTEVACERCIWSHDWEGLLRSAQCDPQSWAGSVRKTLAQYGNFLDLTIEAAAFPPFPFCAVVMMVKNEADIIEANLKWLYHVGVRRIVVLDNGSTDGTAEIVKAYQSESPEADIVLMHDAIVAYFQAEKTTAMCDYARLRWPDVRWILPIDADEFLLVRRGLHGLAYVPDIVHALTIPKTMHFYPAGVESPDGRLRPDLMSVRSHLFAVPPKVFVRALPGLGVGSGNHRAIWKSGEPVVYAGGYEHGFYYREFQTRSFAQFLSKVRNGGAAIVAARAQGYDRGGEHWLQWFDILQQGGEIALWGEYQKVGHRTVSLSYVDEPFWELSDVLDI